MPFFSIIVPTYNSSSTIRGCIQSLLQQNFIDFEILFLDGESSDETLNIIGEFTDKRIRVYSEKDLGIYDAMNKGIDLAFGKWLYFLGSDDIVYDSETFSKVYKVLEKESYDLVYGNAIFTAGNFIHDGEFDRIKLFKKKNICHQSIFYKKDIFARLGNYNLDFPVCADWDFNIRCFSTPDLKIRYMDMPVVYYNNGSGFSNSNIDTSFDEISGYQYERQLESARRRISHLENSKAYILGNKILTPFRLLRKIFK